MPEAITKYAVNDTLGTPDFKPLNKTVSDDAYDSFYNTISATINTYGTNAGKISVFPYGVRHVKRGDSPNSADPFEVAVFPNTVISILENEFEGSNIKQVFLPPSLKQIKTSAFQGAELKNLTIPERVELLSDECFASNTNLRRVAFKGTPNRIAHTAFRQCDTLLDIYVPWNEGEVANAPWGATNANIHYGDEV